jgi:hypothetical protein
MTLERASKNYSMPRRNQLIQLIGKVHNTPVPPGLVTVEGASKTRGYRSDQAMVTESVSPGCGIVPGCPGRSRALREGAARPLDSSRPAGGNPPSHLVTQHPGEAPKRWRHHDPHRHRPARRRARPHPLHLLGRPRRRLRPLLGDLMTYGLRSREPQAEPGEGFRSATRLITRSRGGSGAGSACPTLPALSSWRG